jgi:chromosome segregation ATPase
MLHCIICDQEFKSQFSFEKHKLTIKHITNCEIKDLKDMRDSLQNENTKLSEENDNLHNILETKNMEIEDLSNTISEQKLVIIHKTGNLESLADKVNNLNLLVKQLNEERKKLNNNTDFFGIFTIGGVGLYILYFFAKENYSQLF